MVATAPRTGTRARVTARRNEVKWAVTAALGLAVFSFVCMGLHLWGCMRLDAVGSHQAALQSTVAGMERTNLRLTAQLNALSHPDRLAKIAVDSGMMPVVPSAMLSCPPPARMATVADNVLPERGKWR